MTTTFVPGAITWRLPVAMTTTSVPGAITAAIGAAVTVITASPTAAVVASNSNLPLSSSAGSAHCGEHALASVVLMLVLVVVEWLHLR